MSGHDELLASFRALFHDRGHLFDTLASETGWTRSELMLLTLNNTLGHMFNGLAARDKELTPLIDLQRKVLEEAAKGDEWENRS